MKLIKSILGFVIAALIGSVNAGGLDGQVHQMQPGTTWQACFVPDGPSCERSLIEKINSTRRSLLIQGYFFTSQPIAAAVRDAKKRGVDVRVLLDKENLTTKYSSAVYFSRLGIPVMIDNRPKIAHNKVMIFDMNSIFTGSFNFTKAAEHDNAENGIIITGDLVLAKQYEENWMARAHVSSPYRAD